MWPSILLLSAALILFVPLARPAHRLAPIVPLFGLLALTASLADGTRSLAGPELRPTLDVALANAVTELRPDSRGHYIVQAEIEGSSVTVIVDTGATAVVLSYDDADRAGLKPFALRFDVPVATANGVVKAAKVSLRKVEVDNVIVRDVAGFVMPEGAMKGTLLGMSFLGRLSRFKIEDGILHLEN